MRFLLLIALLPATAHAFLYPYVAHGPVITGVTQTDAWVAWYTAHHQGSGTQCSIEGNTDTPTLTLNGSVQFTDSNCDRYHKVHVTGLSAATHYTFTLDKPWDAEGGTTAAGSFTTAPAAGSGVKFVVYGDTRNDVALGGTDTSADHQAVVNAILANESDSAFLIHTGDMALNITAVSGDDNGYTEFFNIERALLANRPVFVVLGNHETIDSSFFDAMFDPARFNSSGHPYYSSLDWGKVHVALADSFEGAHSLTGNAEGVSDAQALWLGADFQYAQEAGQTSFLAVHQGPYSYGSNAHGGAADVVTKLIPLMVQYGVRASWAGHDHFYERGHQSCIDYMVIGGGGAPRYSPDPTAPGVAVGVPTLSYMVVTVDADGTSSMVVKDTSGAQIDSFTFTEPSCGEADAGPSDDGGIAADAGSGGDDAGNASDSGVGNPPPDSGTGSDASVAADSGTGNGADAGANGSDAGDVPTGTGGGCSSTSAATWGCVLFLALFSRLRARRGALEKRAART